MLFNLKIFHIYSTNKSPNDESAIYSRQKCGDQGGRKETLVGGSYRGSRLSHESRRSGCRLKITSVKAST